MTYDLHTNLVSDLRIASTSNHTINHNLVTQFMVWFNVEGIPKFDIKSVTKSVTKYDIMRALKQTRWKGHCFLTVSNKNRLLCPTASVLSGLHSQCVDPRPSLALFAWLWWRWWLMQPRWVRRYFILVVIIFRQFQTKIGYCVLRPPSSAASIRSASVACTIRLAVVALVVEAAPIKTLDFR